MLTRRRTGILVVLAMLVLSAATACASTVPGTPTPVAGAGGSDTDDGGGPSTGVPPTDEGDTGAGSDGERDSALIQLWVDFGLAWLGGAESAAEYTVEHNHPVVEYSVEECIPPDAAEDYFEAYEPDVTSLEPDPDWTIPDGRYEGEQPEGDVYSMDVGLTSGNGVPGEGPDASEDALTPHVAWLDGEAYFFFTCES